MSGIVAVLACVLAAPAAADVPTTTTTTVTTEPTSTLSSTTVDTTTTAPATTTTTAATTTQPPTTTTTAATRSTRAATSTARPVTATTHPFVGGCTASAVVLVVPHRPPLLLGPAAAGRGDVDALSRLVYSARASIVSGSNLEVTAGRCTRAGVRGAEARIGSLSLFGGAVAASRVTLALDPRARQTITGLRISGAPIAARAGRHLPVHGWGVLTIGTGRPQALGDKAVAALSVVLLRRHAGLPKGTTVLIATLGVPARAASTRHHRAALALRRHRRDRATHRPLRITPPLGASGYVFPVVGRGAAYVDTYGGLRSDVRGHWHHGDDIFAPLGTPVVAIATGTINRVGWERLGGWRLWVRDGAGDEFYYAHLSGYTPADLHSNHVRAGEVIGFIGNTGDAFTTSPHLHFEIHPRSLLHLGYDGAVDPTRYLESWPHLNRVAVPRPAHPPLPRKPVLAQEARYVWRELLVARHLIRRPLTVGTRPRIPFPAGVDASSAGATAHAAPYAVGPRRRVSGISPATVVILGVAAFLAAAALVYAAVTRVRRERA